MDEDRTESHRPTAHLHLGDETWHDGPGWYYTDDEYADEGSCGRFVTKEAAIAHAEAAGYTVSLDVLMAPTGAGERLGYKGKR